MKRKVFAFALILIVALCSCALPSLGEKLRVGTVNDDAAVLADSTVKDVETLNSRCTVQFTVVTRHFLGGADTQEYADRLFAEANLGAADALLLLVIGEERYAVTLGSYADQLITAEQLSSLLSSKLRAPFIQERDYDAAVGSFLLAAASQFARSEGVTLNTSGLFGNDASTRTGDTGTKQSGSSWNDLLRGFFSEDTDDAYTYEQKESSGGSGFSVRRIIIIAVVLILISRSRRKAAKPAKHTPPRR